MSSTAPAAGRAGKGSPRPWPSPTQPSPQAAPPSPGSAASSPSTPARMTEQPARETARGVAASARDLFKVYGKGEAEVRALDGVTVDLMQGEFTAIMGPSGSGKSTLMHCLAALDTPTSGEAVVDGISLGRLKDKDLTTLRRERVGFVFQSFNLVPTLSAEENILLPLSLAGRRPDRAWFDQVVDAVGLRPRLGHRPSEMSGGQQQRVACARALVSRPKIVFADEPTGNLDSTSSAEVLAFLRRSVDEFGQTVVMVSHDPVAVSYTDRVLFLADGLIVDELRDPDRDQILAKMTRLQDVAMMKAAS
jgi:putative ABC transport system ATP-binding protein